MKINRKICTVKIIFTHINTYVYIHMYMYVCKFIHSINIIESELILNIQIKIKLHIIWSPSPFPLLSCHKNPLVLAVNVLVTVSREKNMQMCGMPHCYGSQELHALKQTHIQPPTVHHTFWFNLPTDFYGVCSFCLR